jgi:preprotein translocase SecE subunit
MAKSRAQRKAERRRKQAQEERQRQAGGGDAAEREREAQAQRETQAPVSGEVAEAEAVIQTGARPEDYGEHTVEHEARDDAQARSAVPGVMPEPVEAPPPAPAPSRADVGAPAETEEEPGETRQQRRERKKREKDERRQARERELAKAKAQAEKPEKRRRGVIGFLASCWAELKKVQWPDRDTLVQASAVTIIFVAVMAAYLGALDGAFNWLVQQLL